jgi:coenzyme F420 hydrogenase subunit beta
MTVKFKRAGSVFYPSSLYWRFLEKFTPMRCTLCTDGLAEFADISFGDAWLREFDKDKKGTSIIVVRSAIGKEMLELAIRSKSIDVREATSEMLLRSQKKLLKFKKNGYKDRARFLSYLGKKVPTYNGGFDESGSISLVGPTIFYLRRWLIQKRIFWPLIYKWLMKSAK